MYTFQLTMKSFLKKIIKSGIERHTSKSEEKKIKMLNSSCIFWILFAIFLIAKFIMFKDSPIPIVVYHIIVILTLVSIILFQRYRRLMMARVSFIFLQIINVFLISNCFKPGVLAEYFYILIPLFTIYLIDNKFIQYGSLFFSMLFFYLSGIFFHYYPKNMFGSGAAIGLFLAPFIMIKYLMYLNVTKERSLELQKNKAIKDKNTIDRQRLRLEELNKFQSHFFINISHEIRTPLTLILGESEILKDHDITKYNPELANSINHIKKQSKKIQQIVDDVIDLAKMDSKQYKLSLKEILLSDFLNKLYIPFEPLFKQQNISFSYKGNVDCIIKTDTVFLERALNNIISNSLKYTSSGGNFSLLISAEDANNIAIFMEDNGIGIPDKEVNKIFERFYQVDNDMNRSKGSGVGLAFTKEVIEILGGKISVTSKVGEGSSFKIILPVESYVNTASKEVRHTINNNLPHVHVNPKIIDSSMKRILIVDDHEDMRKYIMSVLQGYDCYEARSGGEAFDIIKTHKMDMIVTDYMMPEMNGYEFVKKVKEYDIQIPILMLTARVDEDGKLETLRLGVNDYITKPFSKEELRIKVSNAILSSQTKENSLCRESISQIKIDGNNLIDELQKFIDRESENTNFGIENIVEEFSISKSSLYRKVKASTGLSSIDFINEVKLLKAKKILMQNDNISLKELSYSVGFRQPSYFSTLYKKRFGIKPIN